jgi:hypothetical protein
METPEPKEKILLISGCSHAAGCEIDGNQDSRHNRDHSFGNVLAAKLNRKPINIALSGSTNQGIARTTLEWYEKCFDPDTMDLMILLSWTESTRMEIPTYRPTHYEQWNQSSDFLSEVSKGFFRVNFGYKGTHKDEQEMIARCHDFMVDPMNQVYLETISACMVLKMQYFCRLNNIPYLMCNTMHMFSDDEHLDFYLSQIDQTHYYQMKDEKESFYWKYDGLGYKNKQATYWHHDEIPHRLFANELFMFIDK